MEVPFGLKQEMAKEQLSTLHSLCIKANHDILIGMKGEGKTILIVEDDEFLRSLTVKRLEKEGYNVHVATDGESALKKTADIKPALLLLDLLLPGVDGFEVLEKMHKNPEIKDTPVIVFSNLGQKEDIEKAKKLGVNDFLIKANFTLDDVVEKINGVMGKSSSS